MSTKLGTIFSSAVLSGTVFSRAIFSSAILTGAILSGVTGCSPLQPSTITVVSQTQPVTVQFGGDIKGKSLLLKIYDVNPVTQEEKLETEWNDAIPANGQIELELSFGTKALYGQLIDSETKAILARQSTRETLEVGKSSLTLNLDGKNIVKSFSLEMALKTLGDIDKAKDYYDNDIDSPKMLIDMGCTEICHRSTANETDRVYPYFDSFPFVAKKPAYQDMAVLVARMIKDIKRNPRDPEVMPPGEGIEDKDDIAKYEKFAAQLSTTVEAEKYPIKRIELNWQVKNMPASGTLVLNYEGDNTFAGTFSEPLFKSDTLIGTISAIAGKDKEVAIVKDAEIPPTRINLRSHKIHPQVKIDPSKIVIVIETR